MLFLGELEQTVSRLKGIGPKTLESLSQLSINTIGQLLRHYPQRYENRQDTFKLASPGESGEINTQIEVIGQEWAGRYPKKFLKVWVKDDSSTAALLCFGREFLEQQLQPGESFYLYGKMQYKYGEPQISSFEIQSINVKNDNFHKILPVYPLSGSLQQRILRQAIYQALNEWVLHIEEEIPPSLSKKYDFPAQKEIIRAIHFPHSMEELLKAKESIIYMEWFHLQLTAARRILKDRRPRNHQLQISPMENMEIIKELPFLLTPDQNSCLRDIHTDLKSSYPMNRLVQGEVGSGKTLVAFVSAALIMRAGGQVAMMVPTELLAQQHIKNAKIFLKNYSCALLTGHLNQKERKIITDQLQSGEIQCLLGTHALFSDDLIFKQLDLVIIDEQHRFGVKQRLNLVKKGSNPHLLLMTATPIPRTLAITAFGDLQISTIKTLPGGRKSIETHLAQQGKEEKVYDFVHGELAKGHQAYFVYPLIEESEKIDLKDAESMYQLLDKKIFPQYKVALIHSRIDEEEKRSAMEAFQQGEVHILVATSVVEVGVDVPNATVMVVEHAERFGLSALHQLRGRIGRGDFASYCFLVFGSKLTEDAKERLRCMKEKSSGFDIAKRDLEIRGPGDITGFRQSGFMKLRLAQLGENRETMEQAHEDVMNILENDAGLLNKDNTILRELFTRCAPFSDDLIIRG
ncbi:MAG: ATP-dependent DNA helicase RecG [Spirochaetaceae bacterium]|jgi:ATP-dependent DNA helicase RecG|nr:ATP-dependent DNA helicase RecG [Spirochaetaceae bacterium]